MPTPCSILDFQKLKFGRNVCFQPFLLYFRTTLGHGKPRNLYRCHDDLLDKFSSFWARGRAINHPGIYEKICRLKQAFEINCKPLTVFAKMACFGKSIQLLCILCICLWWKYFNSLTKTNVLTRLTWLIHASFLPSKWNLYLKWQFLV